MHNIFTKETDPNFKVKHEVQKLHREENGAQNEVVKLENEGGKNDNNWDWDLQRGKKLKK